MYTSIADDCAKGEVYGALCTVRSINLIYSVHVFNTSCYSISLLKTTFLVSYICIAQNIQGSIPIWVQKSHIFLVEGPNSFKFGMYLKMTVAMIGSDG